MTAMLADLRATWREAPSYQRLGSLKIAHAAALHALQVVPVLAWLAGFADLAERRRTRLVAIGAGGYAAIVVATLVQAQAGRSVLAPCFVGVTTSFTGRPVKRTLGEGYRSR